MSFICSQLKTCPFLRISQTRWNYLIPAKACHNPLVICGCSLWSHLPLHPSFLSTPQSDFKSTRNHTQSYGKGKRGSFLEVHKHTWVLLLKSVYTSWLCVFMFGVCESRFVHARTGMQQQEDKRSQCSPSAMRVLKLNPGALSWLQAPFLARPSCWLVFLFLFFFLFLFHFSFLPVRHGLT